MELEGSRFETESLLAGPGENTDYSGQQASLIATKIQFMRQLCGMHDFESQI